jgi:hypothetical protein
LRLSRSRITRWRRHLPRGRLGSCTTSFDNPLERRHMFASSSILNGHSHYAFASAE